MIISLIGYEANIKNRVGSNQYVFELIKALYALDKENQYHVYLPSPPLSDLPPERKNWRYLVAGPSRLWNILGLPRALFQQRPKPDIVFSPGHFSPLFFPAPLVMSVMDLGFFRFPEQFTKPILTKLRFWTALSVRRATHILAISKSTRDDIIKYYQAGSAKITVTPLGYDQSRFNQGVKQSAIEGVVKKYGLKKPYLLFLGTLKPNKNIEGLLEALRILVAKKPDYQLVIVGRKGWMFDSIFEKVKNLELIDKVIFTDFVKDEEIPALMSGAEIFVLPSFWEGFGIPVIEAMACGTPVVASRAGSLPEVVGKAGILVDPGKPEKIAEGINEAIEQKEALVKKGLAQVKKFSWKKCAGRTLEALEKIDQSKSS
jgi:glycosyltransferase involved in cell wall biosynthesis